MQGVVQKLHGQETIAARAFEYMKKREEQAKDVRGQYEEERREAKKLGPEDGKPEDVSP